MLIPFAQISIFDRAPSFPPSFYQFAISLFLQSIIVRAQGEAQSAELIGEAVRANKGFLQLRRLEAARDIANVLATSGNKVMLDAQSLLLNGESYDFLSCHQ